MIGVAGEPYTAQLLENTISAARSALHCRQYGERTGNVVFVILRWVRYRFADIGERGEVHHADDVEGYGLRFRHCVGVSNVCLDQRPPANKLAVAETQVVYRY